jgi:sec-independent protein translocase protein TatB
VNATFTKDAEGGTVFGLTMDKLVIIGVIAAFVIGPQRLPAAAQRLAALVRQLRSLGDTARTRAREELGDSFDDVEWRTLDPRQYDPRRIIRDALTDRTDS